MSAFRVGTESVGGPPATAPPRTLEAATDTTAPESKTGLGGFADRVTKWIPGEVITLYVAAITAIAGSSGLDPSIPLLIAFAVVAALFTFGGAFANSGEVPSGTVLSALLATIAFLIWSLTVPASGWQELDVVKDNPTEVAIAAAIFGILFSQIAEGIEKARAKNRPA